MEQQANIKRQCEIRGDTRNDFVSEVLLFFSENHYVQYNFCIKYVTLQ